MGPFQIGLGTKIRSNGFLNKTPILKARGRLGSYFSVSIALTQRGFFHL